MSKNVIVKVCFLCKEYIHIHLKSAKNQENIKKFDKRHSKHPVQIMDIKELNLSYTYTYNNLKGKQDERIKA